MNQQQQTNKPSKKEIELAKVRKEKQLQGNKIVRK
jgi:hypothetical protein